MKPHDFRSGHRLALTTIAMLIVDIVTYVADIIFNIVYVAYFPTLGDSDDLSGPEMALSLFALGLIVVRVAGYIGTIIFFLMWLHRVYKNLSALNVQGLQSSPGWAVGYWFIPILNLFRPLQVVNEVYHGSESASLKDGYGFANTSSTMLTGFWWGCWLVSNIAGRISASIERAAKDVTDASIMVYIVSLSIGIIAGVLLIFIIQEIDARQAESEMAFVASEPPPPPTFDQDDKQ